MWSMSKWILFKSYKINSWYDVPWHAQNRVILVQTLFRSGRFSLWNCETSPRFGFCVFRFTLNPLRFSLMRETEAKMTKADQFTKLQFLNNKIDQNANFVKLPSAKSLFLNKSKSFLMIAQFLILPFFMSVSLVRENLRGLRTGIKHKIPSLVQCMLNCYTNFTFSYRNFSPT